MSASEELRAIVEENGGGNFAASVYLRTDGFFVQLNVTFMDRLARSGRLARFCELLKTEFTEAVNDAEKSSNGGASDLSGVQIRN